VAWPSTSAEPLVKRPSNPAFPPP